MAHFARAVDARDPVTATRHRPSPLEYGSYAAARRGCRPQEICAFPAIPARLGGWTDLGELARVGKGFKACQMEMPLSNRAPLPPPRQQRLHKILGVKRRQIPHPLPGADEQNRHLQLLPDRQHDTPAPSRPAWREISLMVSLPPAGLPTAGNLRFSRHFPQVWGRRASSGNVCRKDSPLSSGDSLLSS